MQPFIFAKRSKPGVTDEDEQTLTSRWQALGMIRTVERMVPLHCLRRKFDWTKKVRGRCIAPGLVLTDLSEARDGGFELGFLVFAKGKIGFCFRHNLFGGGG